MGQVAGWRVAKLALCMMGFACSSPDASDQGGLPALGGVGGGGGSDAPPTAPSTAGSAGSNVSASHAGSGGVGGSSAAAGSGAAGAAGAAGTMTAPNEDPPDPEADCAAVLEEIATGSTPYPGGRWTVPEPAYDTVVETDVQIAMSDGVMLVGDVSYPADLATGRRASGEFPVILTQNPYGAAFGASSGEIFVTHGYIFASIDVRGTTRSGGVHDMFSPREAEDGAALVAWAAQLEGSDGTVGLQGCSQLGINQLETATRLGPGSPVKAMIPACASGDFYRDTAFDNGIPTIVGAALAAPDAANGGDMAYYREYWKTRDRLARAPAIAAADIPTLLWSGWHEPGGLGSLELYVALQNLSANRPASAPITAGHRVSGKYQVILGDWLHAGGLDLGIQLQWFDTWMKGIDTGLPQDTKTPLHLAELGGTKRWINAKCYPLVKTYTPFYFSSGEGLSRSAEGGEGQEQVTWVAPGRTSASIEYATEPFADGAMLAGPLAARLQVSSSKSNLQLVIGLFDRAPGGALTRISHGSILGSLRRTDAEKSWTDDDGLPARPHLTLDQEQPLTPNERTQLDVPLWPSVWSIEPGHSIVVQISTQPESDRCLDALGVPVGCYPSNPMLESLEGAVFTVHHGGELGSLISLPLLAHGALTTAKALSSPTGSAQSPLPIAW